MKSILLIPIFMALLLVPSAFAVESENTPTEPIPDWVTKSIGFWAHGLADDNDFLTAIQYLINYEYLTGVMPTDNLELLKPITSAFYDGDVVQAGWLEAIQNWIDGAETTTCEGKGTVYDPYTDSCIVVHEPSKLINDMIESLNAITDLYSSHMQQAIPYFERVQVNSDNIALDNTAIANHLYKFDSITNDLIGYYAVNSEDIGELQNNDVLLETDIDKLKSDMKRNNRLTHIVNTNMNTNMEFIMMLEIRVTDLETSLVNAEYRITELQSDLELSENRINDLELAVIEDNDHIISLKHRITTLENNPKPFPP